MQTTDNIHKFGVWRMPKHRSSAYRLWVESHGATDSVSFSLEYFYESPLTRQIITYYWEHCSSFLFNINIERRRKTYRLLQLVISWRYFVSPNSLGSKEKTGKRFYKTWRKTTGTCTMYPVHALVSQINREIPIWIEWHGSSPRSLGPAIKETVFFVRTFCETK